MTILTFIKTKVKVSLKFLMESLDVHESSEGRCELFQVLSCSHVSLGGDQEWNLRRRRPGMQSLFTSRQLNSTGTWNPPPTLGSSLRPKAGLTHLEPRTATLPRSSLPPSLTICIPSFVKRFVLKSPTAALEIPSSANQKATARVCCGVGPSRQSDSSRFLPKSRSGRCHGYR